MNLPSWIRQAVEMPNSQKKQGTTVSQAFPKPTLAGATIAAFANYSYDVKNNEAKLSDPAGNVYTPVTWIADTTANGDEWSMSFYSENAKALSATDEITLTTVGTDYMGGYLFELIEGAKYIPTAVQKFFAGINGAASIAPGSLNTASPSVGVLASAGMQTENGTAPYVPTVGSNMTMGANWFEFSLDGNAPLNVWAWATLNNEVSFEPQMTSPPGSKNDDFISQAMAFALPTSSGTGGGTQPTPPAPTPPAPTPPAPNPPVTSQGTTVNITLSQADTAALGAGTPITLVITPTLGTAPPTPPPTNPGSGKFVLPQGAVGVFVDGKKLIPGDWSFGDVAPVINYASTDAALDGPTCISIQAKGQWTGWQPYFDFGPDGVTPTLAMGNLKYLYIAIKGSKDPQKWQLYWQSTVDPASNNGSNEKPVGVGIGDLTPFALPGSSVRAGLWVVYKVPLGEGGSQIPAGTVLRKFAIQDDTGDAANYWNVDRCYLADA